MVIFIHERLDCVTLDLISLSLTVQNSSDFCKVYTKIDLSRIANRSVQNRSVSNFHRIANRRSNTQNVGILEMLHALLLHEIG